MKKHIVILITCVIVAQHTCLAQERVSADNALALAQKVNNYFMYESEPDPTANSFVGGKSRLSNVWMRGTYYNALMNMLTIDWQQQYLDYTYQWGSYHQWRCHNDKYWDNITNADYQCCAKAYLDMYEIYGNDSMYQKVKVNFDNQLSQNKTSYWTWIDAIHMGMPAYIHMYKITGNEVYLNFAYQSYLYTRNTEGGGLFNTQTGLWWRDKAYTDKNIKSDVKTKEGYPCYWSRGVGWVFAALCYAMDYLEPSHEYYQQFLSDYLIMAAAIKNCQQEGGWWTTSLLVPDKYPDMEVTGSGLFLFGLSWGINNGYLSKDDYLATCDKAYEALAACVHENGFVGYIQGSGSKPSDHQPVTSDTVPDFYDFGCGCWLSGVTEYIKTLRSEEAGHLCLLGPHPSTGSGTTASFDRLRNHR